MSICREATFLPYSYASINWFRFKGFISSFNTKAETSQAIATPQDALYFSAAPGFLQEL